MLLPRRSLDREPTRRLQCSIAFHPPYLKLIEKILPLMPDPSLNSFFWWNSGSEAIEAAIKIARIATGRQNIISMQGAIGVCA